MAIDEGHFVGNVMDHSERHLRGSVVLKHADRSTTGIPDISVSWMGITGWTEMKYLRKRDTLKGINKVEQLVVCHQIYVATGGKCWVIVYQEQPKQVTIWTPRALFMHLWPKLAGPADDGRRVLGCNPLYAEEGLAAVTVNTHAIMQAHGALRIPGWPYDVASRLIRDVILAA